MSDFNATLHPDEAGRWSALSRAEREAACDRLQARQDAEGGGLTLDREATINGDAWASWLLPPARPTP